MRKERKSAESSKQETNLYVPLSGEVSYWTVSQNYRTVHLAGLHLNRSLFVEINFFSCFFLSIKAL
jgi:hypothetical protein